MASLPELALPFSPGFVVEGFGDGVGERHPAERGPAVALLVLLEGFVPSSVTR